MNLNRLLLVILSVGFTLNVFSMGSPYTAAAEGCGSATSLTPGAACTNWTTDGTGTAGDPANSCYTATENQTVWWQFTASSASMNLNIQDLSVNCAPAVAVYSGSCGVLTEVICQQFTSATSSFIMAPLVPGNTYYVALSYASGGPCGNYVDVCIDVCDTPPNDICSGATSISNVPLSTDNFCTTPGPTTNTPTITPADLCAGTLENTAWFTFTVLATADVVITFDNIVCTGGGAGFQIGYFTGSCGSLTNLGCSSGAGGTVVTTITGLNAGDVVTMAVDGNAGADCTFDLSATNTLPLPIELISFNAKAINNAYVQLGWVTQTEINNNFFTIERTKDGVNFEVVGIVDGAGNSTMIKNYNAEDTEPYLGTSYYRLKQTDYDQNFSYSNLVSVNIESQFDGAAIYPNPVSGNSQLTFNSSISGGYTISLFDISGRLIFDEQLNSVEGVNNINLDTEDLGQGVYFIKLQTGLESRVLKLIKK